MKNKLWIVGCSISHGVGVDPGQCWGALAATRLDLAPEFLTAEGSSIEWAADQILRANIQSNDIVLWGLTTPNRFVWYDDTGSLQHILNVYYQNNPDFNAVDKKQLVDLNLAYKAVNYVKQVQNYLDKIGCQYAIGYTLPGLDSHREILINNLKDTRNFFIAYNPTQIKVKVSVTDFLTGHRPVNNLFVDVGSDGFHPGPQQHIVYAKQFLEALNNTK